jgi:hypothetical protein
MVWEEDVSSTQSDSVRNGYHRRDFDDLHEQVCRDESRDSRFSGGISNAQKTHYICGVLKYPEEAFDLDIPFPIEEWASGNDQSRINIGLYLSDLRVQFYEAVMDEKDEHSQPLWAKHAEAEFWREAFNMLLHLRQFGSLLDDERDVH